MKRWALVLAVVLAGVTLAGAGRPAGAQSVQDFTISDFTADYYLTRNSIKTATLHTTESITAQFPSYDQNHGILRALPESYLGHTLNLQIIGVTDGSGTPLKYSTYKSNGNLVLKIGDPKTYVHGVQVYDIAYDERNVVSFQSDHDEFYWDVNGDQWMQPFTQVTARLHVPPGLVGSLQARRQCYVGSYGSNSTSRCTTTSADVSGGEVITSQANDLSAGETMTIVDAFNKGTFQLGPEIQHEQDMKRLEAVSAIALAFITPAAAAWLMYRKWRQFGDDPKGRGVIIPEYQPPKGLDPLTADFIVREKFRPTAFSALLISLATAKRLTIYEIPKKGMFGKTDYELELADMPADASPLILKGLRIVFDDLQPGNRIKLSDLRKSSIAASNAVQFQKLGKDVADSLTRLGYFVKDPIKIKSHYQSWAGGVLLAGIGGLFLFGKLMSLAGIGFAVGLLLAAGVIAVYARYMPARTLAGVTAHDELMGLRDYIKLAEADRLKFLQSPAGAEKVEAAGLKPDDPKFKVKLFESLLPYAMLFGLEKEWAGQFKDIYTSPPDWYRGDWSTFNTVYLANSVSGFSAASSLSFSPPQSSGGSGFGGGGFSGGGGGGGGGGGW